MKKRLATIQVDVDGLWVVYQHFGVPNMQPDDIMYESALPRMLELFKRYNIKATLFVVGRDLQVKQRAALVRAMVESGHEIANHTMSHAEGFSFLSWEKKEYEIAEAERIIVGELGVKPKGFRAPSNDVDNETLHILADRGYVYDSSLLPTYAGPLIRMIKFWGLKINRKHHYLGKSYYGRAPLHPYHPDEAAVHKTGNMSLIEVPITTMPYVRLPIHGSFHFALARFGLQSLLFHVGCGLVKTTNVPLNYLFHTNEFSDSFSDKRIKRQLGLDLPVSKKTRMCEHILQTLSSECICVTTEEYVKAYM